MPLRTTSPPSVPTPDPIQGLKALTIRQFCELYEFSRATAYREIRSGRLKAQKCGRRTTISADEARRWHCSLPSIQMQAPEADSDDQEGRCA